MICEINDNVGGRRDQDQARSKNKEEIAARQKYGGHRHRHLAAMTILVANQIWAEKTIVCASTVRLFEANKERRGHTCSLCNSLFTRLGNPTQHIRSCQLCRQGCGLAFIQTSTNINHHELNCFMARPRPVTLHPMPTPLLTSLHPYTATFLPTPGSLLIDLTSLESAIYDATDTESGTILPDLNDNFKIWLKWLEQADPVAKYRTRVAQAPDQGKSMYDNLGLSLNHMNSRAQHDSAAMRRYLDKVSAGNVILSVRKHTCRLRYSGGKIYLR
ncbi:unnamed protein product [Fusarium graminearum]|nr:unnamed protein product [Fusarium graminearum]